MRSCHRGRPFVLARDGASGRITAQGRPAYTYTINAPPLDVKGQGAGPGDSEDARNTTGSGPRQPAMDRSPESGDRGASSIRAGLQYHTPEGEVPWTHCSDQFAARSAAKHDACARSRVRLGCSTSGISSSLGLKILRRESMMAMFFGPAEYSWP